MEANIEMLHTSISSGTALKWRWAISSI